MRLHREQRDRHHDLARLAVAALRHVFLDPRGLHRMETARRRQSFDGRDALPRHRADRRHARARSPRRRRAPCRRRRCRGRSRTWFREARGCRAAPTAAASRARRRSSVIDRLRTVGSVGHVDRSDVKRAGEKSRGHADVLPRSRPMTSNRAALAPAAILEKMFRLHERLVDPSLNRVTSGGQTVQVEPKIMQVLVALAERPGEVVTRDELMARVWPGVFVTDDVLHRAVRELRRLFDDETEQPASDRDDPQAWLPPDRADRARRARRPNLPDSGVVGPPSVVEPADRGRRLASPGDVAVAAIAVASAPPSCIVAVRHGPAGVRSTPKRACASRRSPAIRATKSIRRCPHPAVSPTWRAAPTAARTSSPRLSPDARAVQITKAPTASTRRSGRLMKRSSRSSSISERGCTIRIAVSRRQPRARPACRARRPTSSRCPGRPTARRSRSRPAPPRSHRRRTSRS